MRRKLSIECYKKLHDIEWLKDQYIIKNRQLRSIAKEIGCSVDTVSKVLKQNNIHVGKTKDPEVLKYLEDREWIENEYFTNNNTIIGIAKIIGVGESVVRKYFKLYDILVSHNKLKGRPFTKEHKQRISIGKKRYVFTSEHKANIAIANILSRKGKPGATKGIPCPIERRLKISAKQKGKKTGTENPFYGKHHSKETRELLSIIAKNRKFQPMKGRKHTPETKEKMSKMANRPEAKARRKAFWSRPEIKSLHSEKIKKRYRDGYTIHGRGQWVEFSSGRKIYLRSSYEIRVANVLESLKIKWEYEPERFILYNSTYHPDFYLPDLDIYWEVKGWLPDINRQKMNQFFDLYPEKTLRMVWLDDIEQLESLSTSCDLYELINIGKDNVNCDKNGNYW